MLIHDRKHSLRLNGYDYSQAGAYFVTIVTYKRECMFGEILGGETRLNELGEIVKEIWEHTQVVRPNVCVDDYVIMPNHFHGILWILDMEETVPQNVHGAMRRIAPTTNATGV